MKRSASTSWTAKFLSCVLCSCLAGICSAAETADFSLVEAAPGVFVHPGKHVGLEDPSRGDSANIGFIVGNACVAVIDTGGSLDTGRALLAAVRRATAVPICFVINTHAHFDHVLGNPVFAALDGVRFVGHHQLPAALAESEAFFRQQFPTETAGGPDPMFVQDGIWVEREANLDLGGRALQLKAEPPSHSAADLTVFDVATATLWSGDLVFVDRMPVLDGNLRGWLKWLALAGTAKVERVVPGHGPTAAPWPAALAPERAYLEALEAAATRAVQGGEFLEDVTARARERPPAGWQVTGPHGRNMGRAFRELEWN